MSGSYGAPGSLTLKLKSLLLPPKNSPPATAKNTFAPSGWGSIKMLKFTRPSTSEKPAWSLRLKIKASAAPAGPSV